MEKIRINEYNCSGISGTGRAWTENDMDTMDTVPDDNKRIVFDFILRYFKRTTYIPRRKPTSYGLKHRLQELTGIYLTNNQFKDAMLACEFKPVNPKELNWYFYANFDEKAFYRYLDNLSAYDSLWHSNPNDIVDHLCRFRGPA